MTDNGLWECLQNLWNVHLVKYRDIDENGVVYGGPMYYLTKGLKSNGLDKLGKVLAVMFAIFVVGGSFGGNMFQVNQAFQLVESITGGEASILNQKGVFGVVMAVLVGIVIIGGIKKLPKSRTKLYRLVVIYVTASLFVIFSNLGMIGDELKFHGAFRGFSWWCDWRIGTRIQKSCF